MKVPSCGSGKVVCEDHKTGLLWPNETNPGAAPMDQTCPDCEPVCVLPPTPNTTTSSDKFCDSTYSVSMFMGGFDSGDNCIVLLFQSWVLDSEVKFVVGCLGTVLLGITVEGLVFVRREVLKSRQMREKLGAYAGAYKLVSIIGYGIQVAAGYLLMLVAMTYSGWLFAMVLTGLVIGHGIFNSNTTEVTESSDACCAGQSIARKSMTEDFPSDDKEHYLIESTPSADKDHQSLII